MRIAAARAMPEGSLRPRLATGGLLTLPNAITFGRLCAVPLAVWLILQQELHFAFGLFVAAGLSDALGLCRIDIVPDHGKSRRDEPVRIDFAHKAEANHADRAPSRHRTFPSR